MPVRKIPGLSTGRKDKKWKSIKSEIIPMIVMGAALLILLCISHSQPDPNPERIRNYLIKSGYADIAEDISFEKTNLPGKRNIYKASIPLTSETGTQIEYWEIITPPYISRTLFFPSYVAPYPDEPLEQRVSLNLSFTKSEYEQLEKEARQAGQSVSLYLHEQIKANLSN